MGFAKRALNFSLATVLVLAAFTVTPALAAKKTQPNNRYASIVMDAETGQILSQSNADKVLYPASLTKMMTLALTFEALENGTLTLRDRVPISQRAANMSPSKLGLSVGSSIRVEDAIYALVTKSANDIAVALAEKVGGSESRFATQMTRKAREIGMNNTRFVNASGWHNPSQVSSARDMAKLGQYLIYRYPQYYHYFSTRNFSYQGKSYHNHNRLMQEYPGMDGLKTGYVAASGFNLVASAKQDNRRLIGVVFGGRSAASRNAHMASLLDKGFSGKSSPDFLVASSPAKFLRTPPVPGRKPVELVTAYTATPLRISSPAPALAPATGLPRIPAEYTALSRADDVLSEIAGEGDYDSAALSESERPWAIQIGAFSSRIQTDKALRSALQGLPSTLGNAQPVIVPLKTAQGWVFRGRLSGYTKEEAISACNRLRECLPVSPHASR